MFEKELANVSKNREFRQRVRQILFDSGYPQYALALNGFKQVVAIQSMIGATDYSNLFLNETMTDEEISLVARHEILHVLLKHRSRSPKNGNPTVWNIAADYELSNLYSVSDNAMLVQSETLKSGCYIARSPEYREMTAPEIYAKIMETVNQNQQNGNTQNGQGGEGSGMSLPSGSNTGDTQENSDTQDGQGQGGSNTDENADEQTENENGQGGSNTGEKTDEQSEGEDGQGQGQGDKEDELLEKKFQDLTDELDNETADELENRLANDMKTAVRAGFDSLSKEEKQEVVNSLLGESVVGMSGIGEEKEEPVIDEVTRLRYDLKAYFIRQERVEKAHTYRKPNKKYQKCGFIMKGRSNKYKPSKTIACYVDVSGSMSEEQVKKGLEVVEGLKAIKRVNVEVYYFNTAIHEKFRAGGGTDYNVIFEHAEEKKNTCIAIITDDSSAYIRKAHELEAIWLIGIEKANGDEYKLAREIETPSHKGMGKIKSKKFMYSEVLP